MLLVKYLSTTPDVRTTSAGKILNYPHINCFVSAKFAMFAAESYTKSHCSLSMKRTLDFFTPPISRLTTAGTNGVRPNQENIASGASCTLTPQPQGCMG